MLYQIHHDSFFHFFFNVLIFLSIYIYVYIVCETLAAKTLHHIPEISSYIEKIKLCLPSQSYLYFVALQNVMNLLAHVRGCIACT